ncbi:PorP/SprF family type IX secretion system membrane protein [Neolewinella lacunae]|uniref:PorP/SprF family type IX secretion system membrane protein n=1 Tax=Neolewinella lacunae TaxID=1517758 RepID=A0A923T6E5_9BACT|nr:PorP/SprF family type IX secretion system membrane protein [Neolewinella lacunae]MBC6993340.1 PorP/SprF family type IX secretion system membrane protein [Neolewinella lacunae]MDN3636330.1 PorP/SprF family type IX secretion system membrane protein [Neolewinella lacunae]
MNSLRLLVAVALLALLPALGSAQDFHYSQFYNAPLHLNPALTGIFRGDVRMMGNYKSQWTDVPVDYKTVTLAIDKKFLGSLNKRGWLSGGVAFNYDRAGDSKLSWANLDLNLSYTRVFSPRIILSAGGKAALVQRSFQQGNLRFNNQYDEARGIVDLGLPTRESFDADGQVFPDFSLGLNLRLQSRQTSELVFRNDRRTKLDLGVALHHITAPDQAFYDDAKVPLERRLSPYAIGTLQILPAVDLVGAITYQNQGAFYDEFVATAAGRVWVKNTLSKRISLMAGLGLRRDAIQDSYWPTFEVSYNDIKVGLNYDFNVSEFDIATENRGGMELSIRYLIRKVRPIPEFKVCPLI